MFASFRLIVLMDPVNTVPENALFLNRVSGWKMGGPCVLMWTVNPHYFFFLLLCLVSPVYFLFVHGAQAL